MPATLLQRPALFPADRRALGQRVYCTAIALLLILSEVFSSNIQSTLPAFSHLARLGLTGLGALLLAVKCLLLTKYQYRWQWAVGIVTVVYAAFASVYGDDIWFLLAVLAGLGAKDVDLRQALRVYLGTAVVCLVLVQLLHYTTPLVPFNVYARNWDYGYGHYNGYGARLLGVFFAWGWLRWPKLRWVDWAGLTALAAYTLLVPQCRGAGIAMFLLLMPRIPRTAIGICASVEIMSLTVIPCVVTTVSSFDAPDAFTAPVSDDIPPLCSDDTFAASFWLAASFPSSFRGASLSTTVLRLPFIDVNNAIVVVSPIEFQTIYLL